MAFTSFSPLSEFRKGRNLKTFCLVMVSFAVLASVLLTTACSSGGSNSGSAQGTGSIVLKLNQGDVSAARIMSKAYINQLELFFYDGTDGVKGEQLLERTINVAEDQSSVVIDGIPAPQDYIITANIYYSDSADIYRSPSFFARVLPGQTAQAEPVPAEVTSLAIAPGSANIGVKETISLSAQSVMDDLSVTDVSASANWTSSDNDIASVDSNGVVTGIADGTAIITATFNGLTAEAAITVVDDLGNSIKVALSNVDIDNLTDAQYKALPSTIDGHAESGLELAIVHRLGKNKYEQVAGQLTVTGGTEDDYFIDTEYCTIYFNDSAQGKTYEIQGVYDDIPCLGSLKVTVGAPIVQLEVSPSPVCLLVGMEQEITVIAVDKENKRFDITEMVQCNMRETDIVQYSNGKILGLAAGSATLDLVFADIGVDIGVIVINASDINDLILGETGETGQFEVGLNETKDARLYAMTSDDYMIDLTSYVIHNIDDESYARYNAGNATITGLKVTANGVRDVISLDGIVLDEKVQGKEVIIRVYN